LVHRTPQDGCVACVAVQEKAPSDPGLARYSEFFTNSPAMLCVARFDGVIKDVNPCWEWTLGFSKAQLRGRPLAEFVHEEDRAAVRDAWDQLARGAKVGGLEIRCLCRDGSSKRFLWRAAARAQEELVYAVACELPDSPDSVRARGLAEPRLASTIDAIAVPVFVKDELHRFRMVNSAYCGFLGCSKDALLGKTGAELAPPQALSDGWLQDDRVLASGRTDAQEIQAVDAEGRMRTLLVVKTVAEDRTGGRAIVGTLLDVSEPRKAG
jgi:PAS domain S-box-containing protein